MKIAVWLLLCFFWSTTWIFIKIGLEDLPPITFAVARFVLAMVILLPVIAIMKLPMPKNAAEWRLVAITGLLQFTINYSTVFWSEQYITSGLAAVLQASITVFGLVLAWLFLPSERITKLKILSVMIGIIGVAIIFVDQLKVDNKMAFAGSVVIVIGSYAAAQSSILIKAKGIGLHPAVILFTQMLCGLPPLIAYAYFVEGSPLVHNWSLRALGSVLYLTLAGTIAAFWLYYWLLARIESTNAMMISLVTPFLAVVIGNVFLGEVLPSQTLIGGALILSSIALIVFRPKSKEDATS